MDMAARPIIGCTTYHKVADQDPPIHVYGLMPSYIQAIRKAGGVPLLIPLGLDYAELEVLFQSIDGLLIPGGGDVDPRNYQGNADHPTLRDIDEMRDWVELTLIRRAVAESKPVLAICRGLQIFNVALGGTLWEDIESEMPGAMAHDYYQQHERTYLAHEVALEPASLLAHTLRADKVAVNSLHHQGIRQLAPQLCAAGRSADGLVEAIEVPGHPYAIGVQWHPENLLETAPPMLNLFTGLVAASQNGHHA
jgi:putative glutamine amidotransferase